MLTRHHCPNGNLLLERERTGVKVSRGDHFDGQILSLEDAAQKITESYCTSTYYIYVTMCNVHVPQL